MSCADKIPSYAEFQALKNEVASLKECCKNSGANDPKSFANKIFDALKSDKGGLALLVGGLLIGGVRVDQAIPQMQKATKLIDKIAPVIDKVPELLGLKNDVRKVKLDLAGTEKGLDRAIGEWKVADRNLRGNLEQVKGGLTDVRANGQQALRVAEESKKISLGARSTATAAATTAGAAGTKAAAAAALGSKLFAALGAVGGAAGLLALYGYFKSVRPTLNAHDSRLDSLDQGFSGVYSSIGRVDGRARAAQSTATEANTRSVNALNAANKAQATANNATNIATGADSTARTAQVTANKAQATANSAQGAANSAQGTANQANATANRAEATANQANSTATEANQRSQRNEVEIEKLKRGQSPVKPVDLSGLHREHSTIIGQNNYVIRLLQNIPTQVKEPNRVPYELLGIPALIRGQSGEISRAANNAATAAANTSRRNLESAAAAGTCQSFQPSACGDRALQRNINPVKRTLDAISSKINGIGAGLSGAALARINVAIAKIDALNATVLGKFAKTWEFLKIDRVLNVISTAASVHNASMISFNVLQSLSETISSTLTLIGIKDPDGNPFSINEAIAGTVQNLINATIGQEAAQGINERWNKLNRIITAGSAVVMAVQSVQWAIAEGIEIMGGWIAHIGNGLRESGTVADRQYPWMDAGIKIKQFSRLHEWNEGLESAENITNQVYSFVATGEEIKESVAYVRDSKAAFDEEFEAADTEADQDLDTRETESAAAEIDSLDLVRVELEEE